MRCNQTRISRLVVKLHSLYRCRLARRTPYACSPTVDGSVLIVAVRECIVAFSSVSALRPILGVSAPSLAPNDTAYKRWSCHSGLKLLCKLCQTSPPLAMGARFTVFGHAGHADPLDGWRCCSQKRVMSRPIQVRQL